MNWSWSAKITKTEIKKTNGNIIWNITYLIKYYYQILNYFNGN